MRARDAVISRPTSVPPLHRGAFAALTLVAWTAFGWLLTPLLTLALWAFGLFTAYDEGVARIGEIDPPLLLGVAGASAGLACILLGWADSQRRRFHGVERRARLADVSVAEVAQRLGASDEVAAVLGSAQVTHLTMDDDGVPVHAVAVRPTAPVHAEVPHQRTSHEVDTQDVAAQDVGTR